MFGLFKTKKRKSPTAVRLVRAATRGAKVGAKIGGTGQRREAKR